MRCPCCGRFSRHHEPCECGYVWPIRSDEFGEYVDWREIHEQMRRYEKRVECLMQENPRWWPRVAMETAAKEIFLRDKR